MFIVGKVVKNLVIRWYYFVIKKIEFFVLVYILYMGNIYILKIFGVIMVSIFILKW